MLRLLCLLLTVALAGCNAGSGQGLDEQGLPTDGGGPAPDPDPQPEPGAATLAALQAEIFTPRCAVCHTGVSAPQGLRLDSEDNSFEFLVDRDAEQRPDLKRVNPGDPDQSYIVLKVEGDPSIINGRMPLGRDPLSAEQIGQLRDWIANGAPRTGTGVQAARVSAAGASRAAPDQVNFNLRFSRDLQLDTLADPGVLAYARIDGDYLLLDRDAVAFVAAGAQQVEIQITLSDLDAQAIKLVVNDSSLATVFDNNGLLLDGDRDGNPGGVFEYVYPIVF